MKCQNPFAFRPGQVTFWTTVVYLAVFIPLIYVHESVPSAPSDRSLFRGLNLTESWRDLQTITARHHPFNSHANEHVREYLLDRSKQILERNKIDYAVENAGDGQDWYSDKADKGPRDAATSRVVLFDDRISNFTMVRESKFSTASATYFEGNNIIIYIRGTEDQEGDWWRTESGYDKIHRTGGVLVNCHLDSVSTGFGATDDGMGCVSILQLLSYFTTEDHQPKNGIVLLFNNGEEDGLFGAYAFGHSPLWQFAHTFVNLEGAGAGGRAILFRATDLEVAKAYAGSPHPFGSSVAADAFERGVIKSGTDYSVFFDIFGQRGVDIAFYSPRARYHTDEDDSRHASVDSIWHMLSAALASTEKLSQTTSTVFNGDRADGDKNKVQNGRPTRGVWFDFFGQAWATFALRGLFAWSLTLLVAAPLVLFIVTYLLIRKDKYYFFARDIKIHSELNEDPVRLGGWKGFFRFPLALIIAGALTIASVLLVAKLNPFIVYSSAYAVWAMAISLFYFVSWLLLRGASFVRPSALQRGFVTIWLFSFGWAVQVLAAVAEDRWHLSSLYAAAFLQSAAFASVLISLLEMTPLTGKRSFANQLHDAHQARDQSNHDSGSHQQQSERPEHEHSQDNHEDDEQEATETTPLRTGEQDYGSGDQTTFASTYRQSVSAPTPSSHTKARTQPYDREQSWSGRLPNWTWFIQFLLLAPVPTILIGNLGLVSTSAMHMTGTDGSSLLNPLLAIGIISIFLLLPLTPFIHRITHHIPLFLLLVFTGTLIYNLVAFPFSVDNRFKFFFVEDIDLDKGTNRVSLLGIEEFIRPVIASLPAASGQDIKCDVDEKYAISSCSYDASTLPPNLVKDQQLEDLLNVTVPKRHNGSAATIVIDALDTRTCTVGTSRPIFGFTVDGASPRDPRYGSVPNSGFSSFQLWRRSWDRPWNVTIDLVGDTKSLPDVATLVDADTASPDELKPRSIAADDSIDVTVTCSYSDVNEPDTIPAFHELRRYMPPWSVVTKRKVGLVDVTRTYKINA